MGLRCQVLGHVHETTEFEEREQKRADETVLICREYQVCSRCGNRKELYRNEQVVSQTSDSEEESSGKDDTTTESASSPSGTNQPEESSATEASNPQTDTAVSAVSPDDKKPHHETDISTESSATEVSTETGEEEIIVNPFSADEPEDSPSEQPEAEQDSAEPDTNTPESSSEDTDALSAEEDGAEILSEPSENDERETTSNTAPSKAGTTSWPGENGDSGDSVTGESTPEETTDRPGTEDTVVLTDSAQTSKSSPNKNGGSESSSPRTQQVSSDRTPSTGVSLDNSDDPDEIRCPDCEGEWDRESTSLRDGDLCPNCRKGYVEAR